MLQCIIAAALLGVATITDIKYGKIFNWNTFPALALGCLRIALFQPPTIIFNIAWLLVFFILGCMGVSGWGDIKCVMALGLLIKWDAAIATYLIAQLLFVLRHLITSTNVICHNFRETLNQLFTGKIKIDHSQKQYFFAPYLLLAFCLVVGLKAVAYGI